MKTALVTGSSSGFGHSMVGKLLEEGYSVLATMRRADQRGGVFAPERAKFGEMLDIVELDVTSATDRDNVAKLIETKYGGKLDLLVNNAGFGLFGALEDMDDEQITHQMNVNFLAVTFLTKKLLPAIRSAKGRIINISSFFGVSAAPLNSLYCASKFALEGFSEALYHELMPYGVQVALVEPGAVKTQFGVNVNWAKRSLDPQSPYAFQTSNYRIIKEKIGARAPDVSEVVNTIVRLTRANRMPLRNFCGRDARMLRRIQRILPGNMGTALMARFFSRTFGNRERAAARLTQKAAIHAR